MKRKTFIKSCCLACISGSFATALLESCTSQNMLSGKLTASGIAFPENAFLIKKKNTKSYKKYVVVTHEDLAFPVCVFRDGEHAYTALLMKCTHQGAELQPFGDVLQCPAHGSEFDREGHVISGPAVTPLRSFPVTVDNGTVNISLQ